MSECFDVEGQAHVHAQVEADFGRVEQALALVFDCFSELLHLELAVGQLGHCLCDEKVLATVFDRFLEDTHHDTAGA